MNLELERLLNETDDEEDEGIEDIMALADSFAADAQTAMPQNAPPQQTAHSPDAVDSAAAKNTVDTNNTPAHVTSPPLGQLSVATQSQAPFPRQSAARNRLEVAENREQRLLKLGVAETLTPLQGKRRRSAHAEGGGGVVLSNLEAISRQLQKNAAVLYQHSPGLPSAVAIHSKFIAIGTDRGLVLLFDHFQEIRQILGSTADSETDGAVASVDISRGSDLLVSGFSSGKVRRHHPAAF